MGLANSRDNQRIAAKTIQTSVCAALINGRRCRCVGNREPLGETGRNDKESAELYFESPARKTRPNQSANRLKVLFEPRREDEPAQLVAGASRARLLPGWRPANCETPRNLWIRVAMASAHPQGYQAFKTKRVNAGRPFFVSDGYYALSPDRNLRHRDGFVGRDAASAWTSRDGL